MENIMARVTLMRKLENRRLILLIGYIIHAFTLKTRAKPTG
jgi:hypothetical protein